jgi:hypothetical protein
VQPSLDLHLRHVNLRSEGSGSPLTLCSRVGVETRRPRSPKGAVKVRTLTDEDRACSRAFVPQAPSVTVKPLFANRGKASFCVTERPEPPSHRAVRYLWGISGSSAGGGRRCGWSGAWCQPRRRRELSPWPFSPAVAGRSAAGNSADGGSGARWRPRRSWWSAPSRLVVPCIFHSLA